MKAGNDAVRKSQRHESAPPTHWPRKTPERRDANNRPRGPQRSGKPRSPPRRCGGRYSASIDGSTTSIPPRPIPARNRSVITDHGPHARAVSAVKTAYQRIAYWKIERRPIRSARRPRTRLPNSEPARAELLIRPCQVPFRPHFAAKIVWTKPTRRI